MRPFDPRTAPITQKARGWFEKFRSAVRGLPLLFLGMPIAAELISELGRGRGQQALAAAGAGTLLVAAVVALRRTAADHPKARRAAWIAGGMVGLAAAIMAGPGAGYSALMSTLFGLLAGYGAVLAYSPGRETVLPDLKEIVPAPPTPRDPEAEAFAVLDARVAALAASPVLLPSGPFAAAVGRIAASARAMLDEARQDSADFSRIRRFLNVYLDGLETLAARYRNAHPRGGALEPGMAGLLADLERAFDEKLAELRAHDLKALDVEREVLSRRLSEQLKPRSEVER
jgi:hypothetical protein